MLIARRIPFQFLVVHLGIAGGGAGDNRRDAARKSIEALHTVAAPLGCSSRSKCCRTNCRAAAPSCTSSRTCSNSGQVGICLDFGHAHLEGDLVDTIETVSEHLLTVDLHDNRGRADEHLVPFDGDIDWPAALTTVQKIGYDGTLMLELGSRGSTKDTLVRARDGT